MSILKRTLAVATATALIITSFPLRGTIMPTKAAKSPTNLESFSLDEVVVTDEYYNAAQESDIAFLCKFDVDRLLSRFRETAGLDTKKANPYGGWEDSYIGGHCVGHYLTAAAQAVKETNNEKLKSILDQLITGLKECQDHLGTGFIFGAKIEDPTNVEKQFNIVEKKDTGETWVPWYNMHKILTGLIDVYKYTGNETALEVAKGLGNWIYNRVSKWKTSTQNQILWSEYGGMNDCLYELYSLTKDENYATAAHKFDDPALYKTITSGKANTLNNRHANATIPKFLGALNRYKTLGDKEYLEYVEKFWDLVISKHSYATGGVSDMEHFRNDEALDATRTQCNCESCCAHNLLRITRELFMITGDVKYADYYENTLRNAIMGSINTKNGTTTYFTPMASGYFKFFGNEEPAKNKFWCCTGTGMENFTKLGDSIYFHNDNTIVINQYVASTLNWKEKGIKLTQESDVTKSDVANFKVERTDNSNSEFSIMLRIPDWISGSPYITVNGYPVDAGDINGGYFELKRNWQNGDTFSIKYPMTVKAVGLPDDSSVYAFRYGPTLLAAKLGTQKADQTRSSYLTWAGANLSAPKYKVVGQEECSLTINYNATSRQILGSETLSIQGDSLAGFINNISNNMVKNESADGLEFKLTGTDADDNFNGGLTFVPFNTLNHERYGIYWYFSALSQEQLEEQILQNKREGRIANNMIDSIMPGYGQYEKDSLHDLQESNSVSGTDDTGRSTRYAASDGYFSYNMKVDPSKSNSIRCKFLKEDNGKTIKISVGDTVIATETLSCETSDDIYAVDYLIPDEVVKANLTTKEVKTDSGETENVNVVKVTFSSGNTEDSARLADGLYITTGFNNNASISDITSDVGNISVSDNVVTIEVPDGTQVVKSNITIGDKFGLLYINDVLVNDGKTQPLTVNGENATYKLKAYGEDHTTSKEYTINVVQTLPKVDPTPVPTVAPATKAPATKAPATKAPVQTKAPVVTDKPVVTQAPATKAPTNTQAPATKAPTVTPAPGSNTNPATSSAPSSTKAPDAQATSTKAPDAAQTVTSPTTGNDSQTTADSSKSAKGKIKIIGKKSVKVGKSIKLKAKLSGIKGKVKWSVNKKKIARINKKTGKLTGKKAGKVKVTARVKKLKKTITIKVKK